MLQLLGSVLTSANGSPDVPFSLSSDDGGDNVLYLNAGSTAATPDGGGITLRWALPAGSPIGLSSLEANIYQTSATTYSVDSYGGPWVGASATVTAQYYDPNNPHLITCGTSSPLFTLPSNPSAETVVPYYYYINLAGSVQDPTCQRYAPGAMVCQRWVPNVCTDTEVAAVWQPAVVTPSWTFINGANYSAGIQLSTLAAPPLALTHTGVSQLACVGSTVRIQFVCSPTSLRPYIASSYKSASANFACAFTFIVPTYLVCTAPGQPSLAAPTPTVANCAPTVNGITYNLAPLGLLDISAYDASGVQYVLRPCGVVANGFGQGALATSFSQLISIPVVCTQPSATINVTSIAGSFSTATSTWSALPSNTGVQLTQATGQNCTATCGGNSVYSGPWQSVAQFVCASNAYNASSRANASVGGYDSQCQPVSGGSCTLTFTTYTSNACPSGQTSAATATCRWRRFVRTANRDGGRAAEPAAVSNVKEEREGYRRRCSGVE